MQSKQIEKLKQEITDLDIDRSNLFKIVDKLNSLAELNKEKGWQTEYYSQRITL